MKHVDTVQRVALSNQTNASHTNVHSPEQRHLKRRASSESIVGKKRLRVEKTQHDLQTRGDVHEDLITSGGHRNCTSFRALRTMQMRSRRVIYGASISSKPLLASFVSYRKSDVYRFHSRDDPIAPGLPFACAFTSDAKRGGVPILAVATQDGTVEILNVDKRLDWDFEPQRTTIQVHGNAILDAKWRMDGRCLGTSSGDSTTRITCVTTQKCLAVLAHHTKSVKSLDWNSDHTGEVEWKTGTHLSQSERSLDLLSTAGRDGSICVWDLRTANHSQVTENPLALAPVVVIPHAHCDVNPRGKMAQSRVAVKTVTSVLYLPQNSQQLISGGSFNGMLKQWDLRYPVTGQARKPIMVCESYSDPTLTNGTRGRGLSSIALGRNYSSGHVWGIAADSCIHSYNLPLSVPSDPSKLSHPGLFVNSFYVKLAVSPCGSWLASGSSGGGIYLWDVASRSSPQRQAVELKSAGREVSAVDWANDILAACCDDGTVRVWRPDQEVSVMCKTTPEDNKWSWSWSTEDTSIKCG